MVSSSPSPRGFDSAEADEAAREAARAEARRYRAEELTNAFPRREIPVGGCPAGARWSPSMGTCVAAGGSGTIGTNAGVTICSAHARHPAPRGRHRGGHLRRAGVDRAFRDPRARAAGARGGHRGGHGQNQAHGFVQGAGYGRAARGRRRRVRRRRGRGGARREHARRNGRRRRRRR